MKAVINEKETAVEKSKYPYIGKHEVDGVYSIILFTSENCGVCLETNKEFDTKGEYSKRWMEDAFTPFTGSITLSND